MKVCPNTATVNSVLRRKVDRDTPLQFGLQVLRKLTCKEEPAVTFWLRQVVLLKPVMRWGWYSVGVKL